MKYLEAIHWTRNLTLLRHRHETDTEQSEVSSENDKETKTLIDAAMEEEMDTG